MDLYKNLGEDIKYIIDGKIQKGYFKKDILPLIVINRNRKIRKVLLEKYGVEIMYDLYYWFNIPEALELQTYHSIKYKNFINKVFPEMGKNFGTISDVYKYYKKKHSNDTVINFIDYLLERMCINDIEDLYTYIEFMNYHSIITNKCPLNFSKKKTENYYYTG